MTDDGAGDALAMARITIDLGALARNWRRLDKLGEGAETGAAVKADAYGLGIEGIVPALTAAGCRTFFAALPAEAVRVRQAAPQARIFVFAGLFAETAEIYRRYRLLPILNRLEDIEVWKAGEARPACALNFDTGMNRLGIPAGEAERIAGDAGILGPLKPVLVMSHLACADEPGHPMNDVQRERFKAIAALFPGITASLANSGGVLQEAGLSCDLTRPGIALYGGEAIKGRSGTMATVARLEARILQIRTARKGETVGYGACAALTRDSRIAIAAAGYADGCLRSASGSGVPMRELAAGAKGALAGHEAPLLGRVSMDLSAFDVTHVPEEALDKAEWIELFGRTIALDDFARAAGTIGYEVLTRIGPRVKRVYVGK